MNNFILTVAGMLCKERLDSEKNYCVRSSWTFIQELGGALADLCQFKGFRQLNAGARGSREMVPEPKLIFLHPWLSPGKPGEEQRTDLAALSAEPFEPNHGAEIQC